MRTALQHAIGEQLSDMTLNMSIISDSITEFEVPIIQQAHTLIQLELVNQRLNQAIERLEPYTSGRKQQLHLVDLEA
jgi:hypothetical protein